MANPFAPLQPVLDLLVKEAEVLPASGRAVVELVTPSPEEIYDREVNPEIRIQGIWETNAGGLYRSVPPLHRNESHRFRFFGMGSTKLFFLGTLLERERSTPIQIAQVGVAVLERQRNGSMRIPQDAMVYQVALVLDTKELSDDLRAAIEKVMPEGYELWNSGLNKSTNEQRLETRLRGARLANLAMRELSWKVTTNLDRDPAAWLVMGQSFGNEFTKWHSGPVIGVARNFRQDVSFHVQRQTRSLYKLLSELRAEMRTAVFPREWEGHRGEIVSWYIRIREGLDFPLAGVLRIEMPNPGGQKVDTALIDDISRHLVAERTVAPHGSGPSWHAHLYPLYLVEKVVRERFYSEEVVKASLRWPLPHRSPILAANG